MARRGQGTRGADGPQVPGPRIGPRIKTTERTAAGASGVGMGQAVALVGTCALARCGSRPSLELRGEIRARGRATPLLRGAEPGR